MSALIHPTRKIDLELSDEEVAARIGEEYRMAVSEMTDEIENAAAMLLAKNDLLFDRMTEKITVYDTPEDPYSSWEELVLDIHENSTMGVFNGGSTAPYMGSTRTTAQAATVVHRAVHDYYGHYMHGVDFSLEGEFSKWHYMQKYYAEPVHQLTFTDVVGQLSFAMQLDGGFNSPDFEQKALLAPRHWIDWCYDYVEIVGADLPMQL